MSASPRLLLLLGQSPFDAGSAAAHSVRDVGVLLSQAGWSVRCLATTATSTGSEHIELLLHRFYGGLQRRGRALIGRMQHIEYTLIAVPNAHRVDETHDVGVVFDTHFAALLRDWRPDVVLTCGAGLPGAEHRERARGAGARVVYALHDLAHLHPQALPALQEALQEPQRLLVHSRFLAAAYERRLGRPIDVLPPPLIAEQVQASRFDPRFLTFVDPQPATGLAFMISFVAALGSRRPDVPLVIVEPSGHDGRFAAACQRCGVDIGRYPNIQSAPAGVRPRDLFAGARVLLLPSVAPEPSGLLAAQALINGVPVLASNRGALPERLGAAGTLLRLPNDLALNSSQPVAVAAIEPWLALALRIHDDDAVHARLSASARAEALRQFASASLAAQYAAYFERARGGGD